MEDRELIVLFLKGDTSAFNALVRRHQRPLYNYLLKMVGNRDDASDLCQKVFIRCFNSLKKLKDKDKFTSWMYTIAVNQVRDQWRKRRELLVLDVDLGDGSQADKLHSSTPSPEELSESLSRAEFVRKALDLLPPEQKEVLILKVYHGLKFSEIAEAVGAPLNTVKSRLYYGLASMKKTFKSWDFEEYFKREA